MTAALTATYLTLLDWAKRQAPGGGVDEIVEAMTNANPILQDMAFQEGNLPTGHRSTIRTGLPTVAWRLLNYGVAPSKSTTMQVDDQCGMLEGFSRVDVDLAKLNGNEAAFRASEDNAFVQGMNNELAQTLFYGDTRLSPEEFLGMSTRYSLSTAANGANVVLGGGAGTDNTSLWLITWGPQTCFGIFPKGSQVGMVNEDLGKILTTDAGGTGLYLAYVTHLQWKVGIVLKDWRYCVRICNLDVSELTDDAATGADLIRKCISAYYLRPTVDLGNMGKAVWYCNKTIAEYFHSQALNRANVSLQLSEVDGKPVTKLLGAPIRICDAIANDEALVS
jgi:hypothetical protein